MLFLQAMPRMSCSVNHVRAGLLLLAAGLCLLPVETRYKLQTAAGDLVQPGCRCWNWVCAAIAPSPRHHHEGIAAADSQPVSAPPTLAAAERRIRQLEFQLARMQEELRSHHPPLFAQFAAETPERLAQPLLIEAAILGSSHARNWRKGSWLDQGKAQGLQEDALILTSEQSVLDLGRDFQVSPADAVLWGRCVIGKVQQVGRWSSTLLPVTAPEFRGRAQLVRQTEQGYVFGPKGMIKGQGTSTCILDGVPADEAVEVGDAVYTADRDGILPTPLFYGAVIEARLDEREQAWRILVQPAELPADLTTVQILRTRGNPSRLLTH